jgi:malate permease and related proteins
MTVELRILLLIALFAVGFIARRLGWLKPPHAGRMLQLVITVGLPALFLADVSRIPLRMDLIALPASAVIIILVTGAASLLVGRMMALQRPEQGAMTICAMSINNGFLFPFAIAVWGQVGFAQMALFDFGNALCQGSLVYATAAAYGGHATGFAAIARRVLSFPPLWALLVALLLNVSDVQLPSLFTEVLGTVGRWILMLVIIALGVLFDARLLGDRRVLATLALRIPLGLAVGYACVLIFDIEGLTRSVVLLGAAAPIGFSAVVIANRENLHRELAASAASISVLLALVFVPLALWLLPR